MADITIPAEAVEAARRAYELNVRFLDRDPLSAACIAMLKAWPGMIHDKSNWAGSPILFLPLTESGNE